MNRENLQILYNMLTEWLQRCIRMKNDLQSLKIKFWLIIKTTSNCQNDFQERTEETI